MTGGDPPRSRVARSILSNWAWYLLVMASGFVLPRLIDEFQGKELLGVWDFSWSLTFYINLLTLGVVSAVNREVARHRAVGDADGLNRTVNSCLAMLSVSFAIGVGLVATFVWCVPMLIPQASPQAQSIARWAIGLLGLSASLQLPLGVFAGIMTGMERFDLLNVIRGIRDSAMLIAMVAALLLGGGLISLGVIALVCEVVGDIAQYVCVRRIAPTVQFGFRWIDREVTRSTLRFGGKTLLGEFARGGLYHMNAVWVACFLGPGALAVISRQRAFVMHTLRFLKQFAQVFVPVASGRHAQGDIEGLRRLLLSSCRYGFHAAIPVIVFLLTLGSPLVHVWMGEAYVATPVLATLACGHVLSLGQLPAFSIMMGMARHGQPALYEFWAALTSVVLGGIFIGVFQWGLVGAALSIAIPIVLGPGILLPRFAIRELGISGRKYLREVFPRPIATALPFTAVLIATRLTIGDPWMSLLVGLGGGGLVLSATYWVWVIPESYKQKLVQLVRRAPVSATS